MCVYVFFFFLALTARNAVGETVWTILLCADVANGAGIKGEHIGLEINASPGL